jgi:cytochrome c-type biogenesis protein CcmH/NrfG
MLRDRPILGYGPDNFSVAFPTYRTDKEPFEVQQSLPTSAHGWPAQVAATSGLVGLVAFIGIAVSALVVAITRGYRPRIWAAAAMMVAFLAAGLTTVSDIGVDWLFWLSAAAIAALSGRSQASAAQPTANERQRKRAAPFADRWTVGRLIAWACCSIGFILGLTVGPAFDASRSIRAAEQHRVAGRVEQAVTGATRATNEDPRRSEYWDGLGLAYIAAQRPTDAIRAFGNAAGLAPHNVTYLGDLVSANLLLAQAGDTLSGSRARDVADRAVRGDPNNPRAHLTRAVAMQVTGDLPEALKSAQRALELDQANNADIYLTATQVLIGLSRLSDAVDMAHRGIARTPDPLNQVHLRIELARALALNGQLTEALKELDALLVIAPNYAPAQQLRAQIQAGVVR